MTPALLAGLLLIQAAYAGTSGVDGLKFPEEIKGVSLGMSGRELVAARPAVKSFAVGIDDPDESPQDIDFGARREIMLFEELMSTTSFGEALYYIVGGTVTAIFLNPDADWSGTDVLLRRPRTISESIRRWGIPMRRIVELDVLHDKRANVPALVWRLRGVVIVLTVPSDDIPKSVASVVYGLEIRPASEEHKSGTLSAPEAKLSRKERERIFASLDIEQPKSK